MDDIARKIVSRKHGTLVRAVFSKISTNGLFSLRRPFSEFLSIDAFCNSALSGFDSSLINRRRQLGGTIKDYKAPHESRSDKAFTEFQQIYENTFFVAS